MTRSCDVTGSRDTLMWRDTLCDVTHPRDVARYVTFHAHMAWHAAWAWHALVSHIKFVLNARKKRFCVQTCSGVLWGAMCISVFDLRSFWRLLDDVQTFFQELFRFWLCAKVVQNSSTGSRPNPDTFLSLTNFARRRTLDGFFLKWFAQRSDTTPLFDTFAWKSRCFSMQNFYYSYHRLQFQIS